MLSCSEELDDAEMFCLNPSAFPTITAGFGIGHGLCPRCISSNSSLSLQDAEFVGDPLVAASAHLFLLRIFPSGPGIPSWYVTRGAGQGSKCGRPTTANEAARVPQKIVPVIRERGCMAGGILRNVRIYFRLGGDLSHMLFVVSNELIDFNFAGASNYNGLWTSLYVS